MIFLGVYVPNPKGQATIPTFAAVRWEDANVMSQNSRDRCVARLRERADKALGHWAS